MKVSVYEMRHRSVSFLLIFPFYSFSPNNTDNLLAVQQIKSKTAHYIVIIVT